MDVLVTGRYVCVTKWDIPVTGRNPLNWCSLLGRHVTVTGRNAPVI
jgi:hypothetical protein